jgi:two-component system, NarL family, nitrate/nitrite response regulator NarL
MARLQEDPGPVTRVFLVDDEPIVRRGLRLLFNLQPGLEVCGEAGGEHEALEGILALKPDLAVVDLTLKEGDGITLIKQLRQLCPALKMLVFSMHDQVHYAATAFAAGAGGYVLKEDGSERVIEAIDLVMRGERYLSERIAAKAPDLAPRVGPRGRSRKS